LLAPIALPLAYFRPFGGEVYTKKRLLARPPTATNGQLICRDEALPSARSGPQNGTAQTDVVQPWLL